MIALDDDTVAALHAAIEAQRGADPHGGLAVGTGWSGPKTLFETRPGRKLRDYIIEGLPPVIATEPAQWELHGWANVMLRGDRVHPHDHRFSHLGGENILAGVFYLAYPEGSARLFVGDRVVVGAAGGLVSFPASSIHWVEPHAIDAPRVSIAFNARVTPWKMQN